MMKSELDQLLATPLPEVEDNGFSEQFCQRLAQYEKTRQLVLIAVYLLFGIAFVAFFPVIEWIMQLSHLIGNLKVFTADILGQFGMQSASLGYLFSLPLLLIAYGFTRLEQ